MSAETVLQHWLDQRLDAAGAQWLRESVASLAGGGTDRDLFRSISLGVSRKLGKAPARPRCRGPRMCCQSAVGLGSFALDGRPGSTHSAAARGGNRQRHLRTSPRSTLCDRGRGRTGGVLPRLADLSGSAASSPARSGRLALEHEDRVRGCCASQPLSRRATTRRRLEPDGAQGAFRGQRTRPDRRPGPPRQCHARANARRLRA